MKISKNSIVINDKNRTIVITKKFATAAKRYGTDEYKELQEVRRDYPNYRVEVKTVSNKSNSFKGLTFDYMESYIRKYNDDEMLKEFFILCGKTEEGKKQRNAERATYGAIKKWFLDNHEELKTECKTLEVVDARRKEIDAILNKNHRNIKAVA